MNIWIICLIVFAFLMWSVLMIMLGVAYEKVAREESKGADDKRDIHYVVNADADVITRGEVEALIDQFNLLDQQVQSISENQQNAPVDISMGAQRRLEMIEPLAERVDELEKRDQAYRDRFTRVERKAGMRV